MLQGVTEGHKGLQEVTGGYKESQEVIWGYKMLEGVIKGCRGYQGVTRGYRVFFFNTFFLPTTFTHTQTYDAHPGLTTFWYTLQKFTRDYMEL